MKLSRLERRLSLATSFANPGFQLDTTTAGADMSLTLTPVPKGMLVSEQSPRIIVKQTPRNCNYYMGQNLASDYVIKP